MIPKTLRGYNRISETRTENLGYLYYRPNRQEILEVEPEGEVDADEIGPYFFQNEVEKDIKEVKG